MKYIKTYSEQSELLNESVRDHLKPKSKEEIDELSKKYTWNQKFENGCMYGFLPWVKDAVEHGIHPGNMNNNGIMTAANYGHWDIVEYLLNDDRVRNTMLPQRYNRYVSLLKKYKSKI